MDRTLLCFLTQRQECRRSVRRSQEDRITWEFGGYDFSLLSAPGSKIVMDRDRENWCEKHAGAGERSDHTRSISPWACFCHVCSIWKPGTDYPTPLQTTYRVKLRHFSPSRKEEKWRRNGGLRTVYGIKSSPLMCTIRQKGWKSSVQQCDNLMASKVKVDFHWRVFWLRTLTHESFNHVNINNRAKI